MPTAPPPVCLLLSRPVTATSLMMDLTSSPNRDAPLPPSSLFWIDHTGKGTCQPMHPHWYWRDREKMVYWFFLSFYHSGKRCAAGLSTRVALARWLLTLGSSSLAAVPRNKRWDPHKWPHASPIRFLSSSRKTWKKTGDCFYWTPLQGYPWHPPDIVSSGRPPCFYSSNEMLDFSFSIKCFFLCGYFFTFLYRGDFLFY